MVGIPGDIPKFSRESQFKKWEISGNFGKIDWKYRGKIDILDMKYNYIVLCLSGKSPIFRNKIK